MRLSSVVLLAVLLLVAPRAAAAADPEVFDFGTVCRIGAIRTCASIRVTTQIVPATASTPAHTAVTMTIANMQGAEANDNTLGSIITKIGLTAPDIGTASNLSVTGPGVGNPVGQWVINNKPIGGPVEFSAGLSGGKGTSNGTDGGIVGCAAAAANPTNYFQTCGGSEAVTFSFRTSALWHAADAEIAYKVQAVTADGNSYECRTADEAGEHACLPVTTVPEPGTMVLLGTGLVLSVAARRRRRKLNADAE